MSGCSRCHVEEIIVRRGLANVVEVIRSEDKTWDDWIPYDIFTYPAGDSPAKTLEFDGHTFGWSMTLYSEQHSRDEDCWLDRPVKSGQRRPGFPLHRIHK